MGEQKPEKTKKHICAGLLAHVDAGKTTLSEGILYLTGKLRRLGRVDDRDSFLDTYELERARGITIFSKQAVFPLGDRRVTLLDTPGHVDFSAEMERTLQVLDLAILIVSGADGVQGHTETLWRLLKRYQVPTFIFVNKMDQPGTDPARSMEELKNRLDEGCVAFSQPGEEWLEELAMCDEEVLEAYLETGRVEEEAIRRMIRQRKVFPCYFGSALKLTGVEQLLSGLAAYGESLQNTQEDDSFGARVFKISRDEQGNRLTHMRITSGTLKVKELLEEEKINQIRIYSGAKYEAVSQAEPGDVCAVTGPVKTYAGQGLGVEAGAAKPLLEPVLTYQLLFPPEYDVHEVLRKMRQLEEEDPMLRVVWKESLSEIQVQVMGQVQTEVLKSLFLERFGLSVDFGAGNIVYKETLLEPVEGVVHFEPLRHYAEVHLLMEPGEPGSGVQLDTVCSEDVLDRNWQRLILTHLAEKRHVGVLTGAELTDVKITLLTGRAHLKHTEGGDFRQATYRAVRQGLREGKCRLLEPYYAFVLEVPVESAGRAMADLERMAASFEQPEIHGDRAVLKGRVPVASASNYQMEVAAYSRGRGRFSCRLWGYGPCHNEAEVLTAKGYDPELDLDNPAGSVFCAHGAGFVVGWQEVKQYMHLESPLASGARRAGEPEDEQAKAEQGASAGSVKNGASLGTVRTFSGGWGAEDKELEAIFTRTYGANKRRLPAEQGGNPQPRRISFDREQERQREASEEEYLLVDGYNIIFAWEELRELAKVTVDGARQALMDILCNYQGYKKCTLILVFDAYKVEGNLGTAIRHNNIHVVYTKEAETADQYIEKLAHKMGRSHRVTVATSDGLEQLIIRGQGCSLLSARDFKEEIDRVNQEIRKEHIGKMAPARMGNYLFSLVDEELAKRLEAVRLGAGALEGK